MAKYSNARLGSPPGVTLSIGTASQRSSITATDILAHKDMQAQLEEETRSGSGHMEKCITGPQHCSNCSKTGHNSCTCHKDAEMDKKSDSK